MGHTADLTGGLALSLNWTVFDGGARRSRLMQAEAEIRGAESQVGAARDSIEDEVWTAYSNLNTAFRQREAATALLVPPPSPMPPLLNPTITVFATCWTSPRPRSFSPKPARQTSCRGRRY